ncbi:MAG TPA: hypothetical protein VIK75_10095 [Calditerricola sp.]
MSGLDEAVSVVKSATADHLHHAAEGDLLTAWRQDELNLIRRLARGQPISLRSRLFRPKFAIPLPGADRYFHIAFVCMTDEGGADHYLVRNFREARDYWISAAGEQLEIATSRVDERSLQILLACFAALTPEYHAAASSAESVGIRRWHYLAYHRRPLHFLRERLLVFRDLARADLTPVSIYPSFTKQVAGIEIGAITSEADLLQSIANGDAFIANQINNPSVKTASDSLVVERAPSNRFIFGLSFEKRQLVNQFDILKSICQTRPDYEVVLDGMTSLATDLPTFVGKEKYQAVIDREKSESCEAVAELVGGGHTVLNAIGLSMTEKFDLFMSARFAVGSIGTQSYVYSKMLEVPSIVHGLKEAINVASLYRKEICQPVVGQSVSSSGRNWAWFDYSVDVGDVRQAIDRLR